MDTPKKHMIANHSMHLHTANRPMYPTSNLKVKIITLLVKLLVKTPCKSSGTSQSCPLKGNYYPHHNVHHTLISPIHELSKIGMTMYSFLSDFSHSILACEILSIWGYVYL